MHRIFLSLGSNLGNRENSLKKAIEKLKDNNIKVIKKSSVIETEPYGFKDQGKFLNLVLEAETDYNPEELLELILRIEEGLGRKREEKWGPRVIDIDIIFYNSLIIDEPNLKIPHSDMHNRFFVLKPLSEIAPDYIHPILKKTIKELLKELSIKEKKD